MIIGIDTRFVLRNRRGIGNYSLNLIEQLLKIDVSHNYILFTDRDDFEKLLPEAANCQTIKLTSKNFVIWEQILLPKAVKKYKVNILHCTGNTAPLFIPDKTKLIVTIHDVMFLNDDVPVSGLYNILGKQYRKFITRQLVKKVDKVITVSEFSKQDIMYFLKLPAAKIEVTWESYNPGLKKIKPVNPIVTQKYIVCLGAKDPRKNTLNIIKVFSGLTLNGYKGRLVILGFQSWEDSDALSLVKKQGLVNKVDFYSYVSDDQLANFYNFADLLLYPSLYEGFGIPPLEAMIFKCPVITANTTSIPEIVGDAAILVSPHSVIDIEKACNGILLNTELAQEMINRGSERVKLFSWTKMAQKTLEIYNKTSLNK